MRAFPARRAAAGLFVACALLASAQSAAAAPSCGADEARPTAQLYFGLAVKDAADITEAQFIDFLDREVTPRFPQGLTVLDAQGRWRSANGQIVREASKLVVIVLPGEPGDRAALDAVRKAYELRFHQDAVLQVISPGCVDF